MKIKFKLILVSLMVGNWLIAARATPSPWVDRSNYSHSEFSSNWFNSSQKWAGAPKSTFYHYRFSEGLPRRMPATGQRVFVFDPVRFQYAAYNERGWRVKKGAASGGSGWCSDVARACYTPRGIFKVLRKKGYECRSSKYPLGKGGAHMPYCAYFHPAGYAIHASNEVPKNRHASHGCIRLKPKDAYWMHKKFLKVGSIVVVKNY